MNVQGVEGTQAGTDEVTKLATCSFGLWHFPEAPDKRQLKSPLTPHPVIQIRILASLLVFSKMAEPSGEETLD